MTTPGTEGSGRQPWRIPEAIFLVLGVVLVVAFMYSILPALTPFVLLAATIFLLYPDRKLPQINRILWLVFLLFMTWFLASILGVLVPFLLAALLAYLLNPAVEMFERRHVPRWETALILMVFLVTLIVLAFALLIPLLIEQGGSIIKGISKGINDIMTYMRDGRLVNTLAGMGIPYDKAQELISKQLPSRIEGILTSLLGGVVGFASGAFAVVSRLLDVVIVLFSTYYLLKDYPTIVENVRNRIPEKHRQRVDNYASRIDDLLGNYLRGTLLIAMIQGTGVFIGLSVIGVDYALVLGIMSGLLNLIPYVGFYSSLAVSLIVASLAGPTVLKLASIVLLYVGLNAMETLLLAPKIIGPRVGLHPVALILSLTIFGFFLGFVGLLIAVPTTAVLVMTAKMWENRNA